MPLRCAVVILIVYALEACQALLPRGELPTVPFDELPIETRELHQIADRIHRTSRRQQDLVRARTALKRAEFVEPGLFGTAWRLARVDGILARTDEERAPAWAREGLEAARFAIEKRPKRVEGHLYYAIAAGLLAKARPTEADKLMNEVVQSSERAIAIDPDYETGEAKRVLGAIYLYAPSWPSGVGDLDAAIETLEDVAAAHPDDPRNLFYLADAYRRADERQKAVQLFRKVLAAPKRGVWGLEGRSYRAQAKQHLKTLTE